MTYEYQCIGDGCRAVIELIQVRSSDRKEEITCPHCRAAAEFKISPAAVSRVGMTNQPFDVAVGRDSDTRWKILHERNAIRDKVRKDSGQVGLTATGVNSFQPISDQQRRRQTAKTRAIEYSGFGQVNDD